MELAILKVLEKQKEYFFSFSSSLIGIREKIDYFKQNYIKSILVQSSVFNVSSGTSIRLDRGTANVEKMDLTTLDPKVATENDLQSLLKMITMRGEFR